MKQHKDDRVAATGKTAEEQPVTALGSLRSGRLLFPAGAGWLRLTSGAAIPGLYQARFDRYAPRVWVQDGAVTVHYGRLSLAGLLAGAPLVNGTIQLNGSLPWEIEIREGVSHLDADLVQLQLRSFDVLGGATQVRLQLSRPASTTFIYLAGGISQGAIHVPPAVELRLRLSGGASSLTFGRQRFGAVGGEMSLQSPGFDGATSRYDICIAGGATNLTIDRPG